MENDECGPGVDISDLMICRVCSGVHGPACVAQDGRTLCCEQACMCVTKTGRAETWPGYDFPIVVELCRCCGRVALRSGSRWSVWFCNACKPKIIAINQACDFAILPLGRHSVTAVVAARLEQDVPEFARGFQDWFARIEVMEEFAVAAVFENLKSLAPSDHAPDISLVRYLEALPRSEAVVMKGAWSLGRRIGVPDKLLNRAIAQ